MFWDVLITLCDVWLKEKFSVNHQNDGNKTATRTFLASKFIVRSLARSTASTGKCFIENNLSLASTSLKNKSTLYNPSSIRFVSKIFFSLFLPEEKIQSAEKWIVWHWQLAGDWTVELYGSETLGKMRKSSRTQTRKTDGEWIFSRKHVVIDNNERKRRKTKVITSTSTRECFTIRNRLLSFCDS